MSKILALFKTKTFWTGAAPLLAVAAQDVVTNGINKTNITTAALGSGLAFLRYAMTKISDSLNTTTVK
jgi:hypothetical protein